jgi:hypothetical protein
MAAGLVVVVLVAVAVAMAFVTILAVGVLLDIAGDLTKKSGKGKKDGGPPLDSGD